MKILLFSNYDAAFLECITYQGLVKNVGAKNVKLFKPKNIQLHQSLRDYDKHENLVLEEEITERIDEFDNIILFNGSYFGNVFDKIMESNANKIFMDGNDDFFIRQIYKHPGIKHYFKTNLLNDINPRFALEWSTRYSIELYRSAKRRADRLKLFSKWGMPIGIALQKKWKVSPFPLTVIDSNTKVPKQDKDIDLSFIGALNVPDRKLYYKHLLALKNRFKKGNFYISSTKVDFQSYVKLLKRSKLSLSMRGVSMDAWRYWEIPCYGSALLAQKTPLVIPNNFIDEKSALFFDNPKTMESKFEQFVVKTDDWKDIEREGRKQFLKYHTPEMRVKNLLMKYLE